MAHPKLDQVGGYRVLEYINEGGMAWVFKVQHPNLDRRLALKLLKTSAGSGDEVRLFKREIDQLTKATHPNLVWILDQGQDPQTGSFWYAMEYLSGDTVRDHVARHGPMDAETAVALFKGLLAGLQTLHSRNVVHRDIKPSNIMIEPGNQAKLMDLGIARVIEGEGTQDVSYTNANIVRGTPAYMAPEQSSAKSLTPAADIFAVGLTLYYALTGRTVYEDLEDVDSTSAEDIRGYLYYLDRQHRNLKLKLPRDLPRGLQDVVRKATSTEPSARYQTAGEMLADLDDALVPRPSFGWLTKALAAAALLALLWFAGPALLEQAREFAAGSGEEPAATQAPAPEVVSLEAAEAPRRTALAAQEEADRAAVELPEYAAQMQRAKEKLEAAQGELDAAADPAAVERAALAFAEAGRLFVEASAVGAASERRKEANALEQAKRDEGVRDFKRWDKIKRSAELSYSTRHYTNAEDDYSKGIAYLHGLVGNAPPRVAERTPPAQQVQAKRGEPLTLSVAAADPEGGALDYAWSVDGSTQADQTGPALALRPSRERHEVTLVIRDADGREVQERWIVTAGEPLVIRTARPSATRITTDRGKSVALSIEASGADLEYTWKVDGRTQSEKGPQLRFDAQRSSSVEVAVRNPAGESASRSWQVVVEREAAQPAPIRKPKPLRILSRDPLAPVAAVERGKALTLGLRASGDDLAYLWKVGGQAHSESGPSITIRPSADVQVEVTVEDKYGKRSSQAWDVVVQAPAFSAAPVILSRTPSQSAVRVTRGTQLTLAVEARGDTLRYAWSVDGRPSSETGSTLRIRVDANTRVVATVSHADGRSSESSSVSWDITAAAPAATTLDGRLSALLSRFESAYESCNKAQLAVLWDVPAAEDGQWRYAVCKSEFDLSLSLVAGSASEDRGQRTARACANWKLDRRSRGTVAKRVTLDVLVEPNWNGARILQLRDGCDP